MNSDSLYSSTHSGPTWKETQLSEAHSYANLAAANNYFNLSPADNQSQSAISNRILLEDRALDSYYNILFSLILFWRTHGVWPEHLTIVSHAFKRARLVDGHCAAIGFPLDRVSFVGINPPGIGDDGAVLGKGDEKETEKVDVMSGVGKTLDDWEEDPHGVSEVLAGKRRGRNPWGVGQGLFEDDKERRRSGLHTRFLEDGTEVLMDDGKRPWSVVAS